MDREEILRQDAEQYLLSEAQKRRFLYKDVSELIEVGVLSHTVRLPQGSVTLRTLQPKEKARLERRLDGSSGRDSFRWVVASSLWFVNGFELSWDPRDNAPWHAYQEWVQDMPDSLIKVLYSYIIGLKYRYYNAVRMTEAFCYEPYGRSLWRTMGRPRDVSSDNLVKQLWAAYNSSEDEQDSQTRQWQHTLAMVGSMSGKASKGYSEQLRKLEDREQERRQRVVEDAVNWAISGEREEQAPLKVTVNGREYEVPQIRSAQTNEDLHEEMRKVMTGEKDFHDKMVDDYHRGVRLRAEQKRLAYLQKVEEARRAAQEAEDSGTAPVVGYTREQLSALNPNLSSAKTTAVTAGAAGNSHMFDRYFSPELKPGVLTPALKVEDAPAAAEAPAEGQQSLQDRIRNRNPAIRKNGE